MRLRGDCQYLFVVLYLFAAVAAEPIPRAFQDATEPLSSSSSSPFGNDLALSSQTSADGDRAVSADLSTDTTFLEEGKSSDLSSKPADSTLVAVGLPTTESPFGPPIPQYPTLNPKEFGAYPGYPQPADVPYLYDPRTRQKQNGHMEYYEQIRGECPDGEELYCCRWGKREVLGSSAISEGPIKCIYWPDWFPKWRVPQCIPEQQQCCAKGVDQFGNGVDCKKANKASNQKQKQGAAAHDGEEPHDGPPGGNNEQDKAPASQRERVMPGVQQFEKVDPLPERIPESSSDPWNILKLWPLGPLFQGPQWSQR